MRVAILNHATTSVDVFNVDDEVDLIEDYLIYLGYNISEIEYMVGVDKVHIDI